MLKVALLHVLDEELIIIEIVHAIDDILLAGHQSQSFNILHGGQSQGQPGGHTHRVPHTIGQGDCLMNGTGQLHRVAVSQGVFQNKVNDVLIHFIVAA